MADGAITEEQRQKLLAMVQGPSGPAGGSALTPPSTVAPSGPSGGGALPPQAPVAPSGPALPRIEVGTPQMAPKIEVGMPRMAPKIEVGTPVFQQKDEDAQLLKQIQFRREREEALKRGELIPMYEVHGDDEPFAVAQDAKGTEYFIPAFGKHEGQFIELPKGDYDIQEVLDFARGGKKKQPATKPKPMTVAKR